MARIMITNGGPHPADKWGVVSAEHIFPINEDSVIGDRLLAAKKFQITIADILSGHHADHQKEVRGKLASNPEAHLTSDYAPEARAKAALDSIVAAAKGTPFEAHFSDQARQQVIMNELASHFATNDHIERSWHCDRNASNPAAKAFKAQHTASPAAAAAA